MEQWKQYNIGEICDTISETYKGNASDVVLINTSDVLEGKCLNHTFVANKNLRGQFKKQFKKNDILYSEIRPANKRYAFIDFESTDYIASTKLMVIRSNDKVLPKYLYYVLQSKEMVEVLQMLAESRSGTFPQITFSELAIQTILLPEIREQSKIVDFLESIDSKIALNRRINDNLEQQAQALFDYYFSADSKYLSDSERGVLTNIAVYLNGLAMQKFPPTDSEHSLPVLKIKELGQGKCDNNSDRCSNDIDSNYVIDNGNIIFSWSGTLMVDVWCGGKCGLNQHLFKVTPLKDYPQWFIYYWTIRHLNTFKLIAKDKAVTMGHIKRGDLEKAEVIIPNRYSLVEMNAQIEPLYQSIINNRLQIAELETLRDALLPRLMSGELKINDLNC